VDTNVERVISRLEAITAPDRARIKRLMLDMMPADWPGDFVQAMMDLGATICRPRSPNCTACPLAGCCKAFATGKPAEYPAPRRKPARPQRYGIAWWIERDGHVWLVRRPEKGMLGGMAALPGPDWTDERQGSVESIGKVRHVFTHFALDLQVERRADPTREGWWHPIERLDDAGLPTLYRRAAELALADRPPRRAAA
jgi:A/G-specific adenine glycosylase